MTLTFTTVPDPAPPVALPGNMTLPPLRQRWTREGECMFREVAVPIFADHSFKTLWKTDRVSFLQRGFFIRQHDGKWTLSQWLRKDGEELTLTSIGQEKLDAATGQELPLAEPEAVALPDLPALPAELEAKLFDYQIQPARQLLRALNAGTQEWRYPGAWDCSDLGCHARGQLIMLANGYRKPVEKIEVGDFVMGWKGVQQVTALKRGRGTMAIITPTKGEAFTVNLDHILTLQYSRASANCGLGKYSGKIVDISVREYLKIPANRRAQMKLLRAPVECWPPEEDLPIPHYFMGVLLGDGSFRTHSPSLTTKDGEIVAYLRQLATQKGWRIVEAKKSHRCPSYFIRGAKDLIHSLRDMGLWNVAGGSKFIPHCYKTGGVTQRLEVLAGLMDTDGSATCGGYDYISKSLQLASDVVFLARSVGLAAYMKPKRARSQNGVTGDYWRVSLSGDCHRIPCKIDRKRIAERVQKKSVLRTGFRVQVIDEDEYYGFSLSGDGRFLLGDFTVTHNTGKTYQALAAALATGLEVGVICPLSVIPSWQKAFKHFGQCARFIRNYESLRTGKRDFVKLEHFTGSSGRAAKRFQWQLNPRDTVLLFDEAHNLKNAGTLNQGLAMAAIRQRFPLICISGTLASDPTHMRATGRVVGLHSGEADYIAFLERNGCAGDSKSGKGWTFYGGRTGRKILAGIHREVFPLRGSRTRIADLGDRFPETQIMAEAFETGETKAIAEAFLEAQRTIDQLEAQGGKSENEIKMLKGSAYMKAWHASERLKVPSLCEMIHDEIEEGRSVAVFVNFTDVREALMHKLKTGCAIFGGQPPQHRQRCIEEFQAGQSRVIICNIDAGGVGVSLHDESGDYPRTAILLPTNKVVSITQALGRVRRAGGKSKSRQIIMFASGTVEEQICDTVRARMANIATLNDGDLNPEAKF